MPRRWEIRLPRRVAGVRAVAARDTFFSRRAREAGAGAEAATALADAIFDDGSSVGGCWRPIAWDGTSREKETASCFVQSSVSQGRALIVQCCLATG